MKFKRRIIKSETLEHDHFAFLDGLRGIAILIVILVHFGINHYLRFIHIRIDSRFGVDIFFVLSGFLITTRLLKEKSEYGTISLKNFYLRRVLRIIPLVYLYLIVLLALTLAEAINITKEDFIYSFLFLKNLPIPNERFTAHLWTLAVEWQFYIAFPLLLLWLGINRTQLFSLLVVITFPLLSIIYEYGNLKGLSYPFDILMKGINYSFWKGPVILLVGATAALLYNKVASKTVSHNFYLLGLIIFILALLFNIKSLPLYFPYVSQWIGAILIAFGITLNFESENLFKKILQSPPLIYIGIVSYSIYIWQQLFIGWHFYLPGFERLNQLPVYVLIVIKLFFIMMISYISYYYFERSFLNLLKKRSIARGKLYYPNPKDGID